MSAYHFVGTSQASSPWCVSAQIVGDVQYGEMSLLDNLGAYGAARQGDTAAAVDHGGAVRCIAIKARWIVRVIG